MGTRRDLRRAGHKIMAMHKMDDDKTLAVGKEFTFPKSGESYVVQETGAVVNMGRFRGSKKFRLAMRRSLESFAG